MAFYFDFFPPFYFLKWNCFFLTLIPVLSESGHYFNYLLSWEVCTNLPIKRFPLMKLWYTIWMYRALNNNIKKHLPHIYTFWKCLIRNLLIIRLISITFPKLLSKDYEKLSKKHIIIPQHNPLVLASQNLTIIVRKIFDVQKYLENKYIALLDDSKDFAYLYS